MHKRLTARVIATGLMALLGACGGDRSVLVAPLPGDAAVPPMGVVQSPDGARVHPVHREASLEESVMWSFDVGAEGAVSRNRATGLTITIPPGALLTRTRITVTAIGGTALAYRFEPHGLQFAAPVELSQSLNGLKIKRDVFGFPRLFGGYFAEDTLAVDATTGTARVTEIMPVWLDGKSKAIRLEIRHFSGYTVASALVDQLELLP